MIRPGTTRRFRARTMGDSAALRDDRKTVRLGIGRYADLVVFSVKVKKPQSVAGRIWNLGQEALGSTANKQDRDGLIRDPPGR
jgi:hypothetical protein